MELREGYKNREVGVIFEDWEVKSLDGVVCYLLYRNFWEYQKVFSPLQSR